MKRKISLPFLRRARVGQIPEYFIGGSILLSKGGSVQMGGKGDGGVTWKILIGSTVNDGQYSWRVTGPPTKQARIKISSVNDPAAVDVSGDFEIGGGSISLDSPSGGITWPIWTTQTIKWTSNGFGGNVRIELSRDGGESWKSLIASTANDGEHTWKVTGPSTTQARIRVRSVYDLEAVATSGNFTIGGGSISLNFPYGEESWSIGSAQTIQWTSSGFGGNVKIEISRDGGTTWRVISASTANDGEYAWKVTGPATNQARIRVKSLYDPDAVDTSEKDFKIQ